MMQSDFDIHIANLKDGGTTKLDVAATPKFLEVEEPNISFVEEVKVTGEAYLVDENLVLHIDMGAVSKIPCNICGKEIDVPIFVKGFYHLVPLNEVKGAFFNAADVIRESILLEAPTFVECSEGQCPERGELKSYMREPGRDHETYQPFKDLKIDEE